MTLLEDQSDGTPEACAAALMDTVPLVMRAIRTEMRSHRPSDLSVQQFRALRFVYRHPGASLSEVAEHVGLTLPSTSKMIDRLVTRHLINREPLAHNRRRMSLTLTPLGQSTLEAARAATQAQLSALLAALPAGELADLVRALGRLRPIFTPGPQASPGDQAG